MKNHAGNRLSFVGIIILLAGMVIWQPGAVEAQTTSLPAQMNLSFSPASIPTGGTSVLSVTIYNPNSFALNLSSLPAGWYLDFVTDVSGGPVGIVFASTPNAQSTCGGVVSTSGTRLSVSGGTVPAEINGVNGSCTVTVNVTSTTPSTYTLLLPKGRLVATDPTGTIAISNGSDAKNSLVVNTVQPPSLSKSFSKNTIWVGQTIVMSIKITNNDPNYSLTQVSLTDVLPTNVYVFSAPSPSYTNCGSSVSVTGPGGSALANATSLTINNATIASSSCTVSLTVTSVTPGSYLNTIPASAIHSQQGVTNASAASAPLNVQPIGLTKSFSPSSFQVGGTSQLTITLQNPSISNYTSAAFTDFLPSGVTVVSGTGATTCNDTVNGVYGAVSTTSGSVSLSGGTINAGTMANPGSCTVTVKVTSSIAGTYTNSIPIGALTAYNNVQSVTNVLAATTNLTVYGIGGGLSTSTSTKIFSPSTIAVGGVSTLTVNFTAPADVDLTNFTMSDALPTNVFVANTPSATKNANCGSGTFTPAAGDTLLTFTGGTIPAGKTCTLTVKVTSNIPNPPGSPYTNIISPANISDDQNRNFSGTIQATLTVTGLSVSKAFYPSMVNPGGISTLTITLTNTNSSQLDNVSLTDSSTSLGTNAWGSTTNGIMIAPNPNASTTCPGGTVNAVVGAQSFTMTGGIIPAQVGGVAGLCTISVDIIGKGSSNTYTDTIPASTSTNTWVTGEVHGTSTWVTNPAKATATLQILPLTITVAKWFDPLTVFGGSASTLYVQLINPNTVALNNISFTDNLPQGTGGGMYIAAPTNFSVGTCGGTLTGSPGDTSFSYSGGTLASGASCSLTLSVSTNVNGNLINTIGIGTVTSGNGASNTLAASATLTNTPGVSISKAFSPNPVFAGTNVSTLTITIQNTANFALDGMGMTDTFPSGVTVADTPDESQCGGTVTSTDDSVTLTGGALAGLSSCTVKVDLTAPAAGTYQNCIAKGALTTTGNVATNQTAACDTLTVNLLPQPPSISKTFSPSIFASGGTSTLTFTITNPSASTVALTGVGFTDPLTNGLTVASVPNPTQCNGGSVSYDSVANSISLVNGTVATHGTCTVTVSVTSSTAGTYTNTSNAVTSSNAGAGNQATANWTVVAPPSMTKSFTDSTILVGQSSTLTFTITNPNTATTLTGVGFTDALPSGMQVASTPNASTTGCSTSTFAPAAGDTSLTFSNGSILGSSVSGGGTCTVNVDVFAGGGTYNNTSGAVTSTNGGTGNTANATLVVQGVGLSLVKSTTATDFKAVNDTINYSYLLTNTGTARLYAPYSVSDNMTTVTCPTPDPPDTPLKPGDSVTCTSTYMVSSGDVTAKSITNMATATANDAAPGNNPNPVTSNQSTVTVKLAALKLTKSNSTLGYQSAGNTISYSYILTNVGSVALYPPYAVTDTANSVNPVTVTCPSTPAILNPGANVTCSATYSVKSTDGSSVTNNATATAMDAATGGSAVTSNQASVTVYEIVGPQISKSFSPSTIGIGSTSLLTFTITNPSTNVVSLTGVSFSDTFAPGASGVTIASAPDANQCGGTVSGSTGGGTISLSGGSIIPNGSCTVTVSVTSSTNGTKNNTSGKVSSSNGGTNSTNNTATATLLVVAPPTITKSFSPSTILVGGTTVVSFTLTAPASNPVNLTGVSFTDDLPAGMQWTSGVVSATDCYFHDYSTDLNRHLSINLDALYTGYPCTMYLYATATTAGTFYNTTSAVTTNNGGTGATSNTAVLTANESADLSITKDDGKHALVRGQTTTYDIVVTNNGPSDAVGASVVDTLPSSLTGAIWTCTPDSGASCTASGSGSIDDTAVNIPAYKKVTYAVTATVSNSTTTDIVNTAVVLPPAGLTDSNINNNIATDTDQLNKLTIVKSVSPSTYATTGVALNYSYTITNTGTSTLSASFAVVDNKVTPTCTSVPSTLAPNDSFTCTATYSTLQSDLDVGSIVNTVYATGVGPDFDTVTSNTDTKTVTAVQNPQLTLVKSITAGNPFAKVGDTISYSYLLTNTGNVTLTGPSGGAFTVTDNKTTVTCPGGTTSLAPGASVTCTAVPPYTVVAGDLPDSSNGTVTNTATAHAAFGSTPVNSNTASTTAHATPDVSITKTPNKNPASPNDVVIFTLGLRTIHQDVSGVTLTETLPAHTTFDAADSTSGWSYDSVSGAFKFSYGALTAAAGTQTVLFAVKVDSALPSGVVDFQNTATVADDGTHGTDSNPANNTATVDVGLNAQPAFTISKTDGVTQVAAGSQMTYIITVTNTGNQDATGVVVKDVLDSNVDFVSATPAGQATYDSSTNTVTWISVNLAAQATLSPAPTVTVKVHNPLTGVPGPTQIINNVQVDDDHSNGTINGNNIATASDTDGISFPTKTIVGHDGPAITLPQVAIGEGLLYETTVQITPGTVTNLKLVDTLDHGLAFWKCVGIYGTGLNFDTAKLAFACSNSNKPTEYPVSVPPNPENLGRQISFDLGTVTNPTANTITLHVRYWAIVLDVTGNVRGTTLNNNAQWTWDGGSVSAQAGAVTVLEAALTLTKVSDGTVPAKGRVITYTLTLDHAAASNEDAYDVVLSDVVPLQMAYVPGSLKFISGQTPTQLDDSGAPALQVKWNNFQLDPTAPTVRQTVIQFQATVVDINPGQTITNTASVEWRSMHNPDGLSVARSPWNTYSTERHFDPANSTLNNYRTTAQALIRAPDLPNTGFAPGQVTLRELQTRNDAQNTSLSLEIPALKVNVPIVGIPYGSDGWDLTWLEKQAGYLEGTAYPTWTGNSVITGHVYNADGTAGIFVNLSTLKWGDQVIVHDGAGQEYIYEVRDVERTTQDDLSPLQHKNDAWVTLLTCEGYDATTNQYTWRVAVSAVLIKVQPEQ